MENYKEKVGDDPQTLSQGERESVEPICHRDWDDSQLSKSSLDLLSSKEFLSLRTLEMASNLIPTFSVVVASLQDCWVACVVTPRVPGVPLISITHLNSFGGLLTLDYGIKLRQVQA